MYSGRSIATLLIMISIPVSAAEMTFDLSGNGGNCYGCEWVAAQGEITIDTPDAFRRFVAQHGNPQFIILNSRGGNLFAGVELGKLIRDSGASTSIGQTMPMQGDLSEYEDTQAGFCLSACVFAFMGGVERWIGSGNVLGVHQFYSLSAEGISSEVVQRMVGLTLLHTMEMGINPAVIVAASATHSDEMYFISEEESIRLKLDTSGSFTDPWRLEPYKEGLVLATTYHESVRRAADITLFCRSGEDKTYLLVSESSQFYAAQFKTGEKLLEFSGEYPNFPSIQIGDRKRQINETDIEFQRLSDGRLYLSIRLPPLAQTDAQARLTFDPNLPRVYGNLISASVDLPTWPWLDVILRNCI